MEKNNKYFLDPKDSLLEFKGIIPIISIYKFKNEIILNVLNKNLLHVLTVLKKHIYCNYDLLTCISGVDLVGQKYRFCIVYDLLSIIGNARIRVKVFTNEVEPIKSCISVFINANWWEREIWDLYGIYFVNHPDLRRLLTDYGFEGHPMRKDFPLSGYIELRYNEAKKRITPERVQLAQEYRTFSYEISWQI